MVSLTVVIQSVVLVAAVFLLVRGVQVLLEYVQIIEARSTRQFSLVIVAYVLPLVVCVVLASGRLSTALLIMPLIIGVNLLSYGLLVPYLVMSQRVVGRVPFVHQLLFPAVLTYGLLLAATLDGVIDRFEAGTMLVLAGVLFGGMSAATTPVAATETGVRSLLKQLAFLGIALSAVCLGARYLFVGLVFFSTTYSLSLPFLAVIALAPVLLLPLLLATFTETKQSEGSEALRLIMRATLLMTLLGVGVAGCLAPLVTDAEGTVTGLWYVLLCLFAAATLMLTGATGRRAGLALFLLGIFSVVKLVTHF